MKSKKEEFEHRKKKVNIMIPLLCIVLVVGMVSGCVEEQPPSPLAPFQSQTEVRIPLSEIGNNAKFYTYDADGVTISYFAVSGSDGDVHAGFDACDVCYHAKKGYKQIGDVMHCINCGLEFSINSIGTENTAGGCWPSYLPMSIDGNEVVIKIFDLEAKRHMF